MTRQYDLTDPDRRRAGLDAAAASARRGRLVLLPTETTYALLADAFSASGLAALRRVKDRPDSAALPVAVSSLRMLRGVAERLTSSGQALVEAFWPGPLTIVCRAQPSLAWTVSGQAGRALTVRMPVHPVALQVIRDVGPCVLIGADEPAATDPAEATTPDVDVVLYSGPCTADRAPSTVVDVRDEPPTLLRAGSLGQDRVSSVVPTLAVAER